jgi:hypothetical protein
MAQAIKLVDYFYTISYYRIHKTCRAKIRMHNFKHPLNPLSVIGVIAYPASRHHILELQRLTATWLLSAAIHKP